METHRSPVMNMNPTPRKFAAIGPLTAVLMGLSVVLAIWSRLGADRMAVRPFLISEFPRGLMETALPEVVGGEVWRLVTPIFLHFGIMHLLFNMMWLKELGTGIENLVSTRSLFLLTLVSGVVGNLGQYVAQGPFFGGMSGVVYALFGYVWMKAKFQPMSGFRLDKQTVLWMVGWFVLCLTGAVGPVANVAHGAGLVVGVIWGFLSAKSANRPAIERIY